MPRIASFAQEKTRSLAAIGMHIEETFR